MPTPRAEFGTVVLDGLIYTIGGTVGTAVNFVEVYDPARDTWSTRADMPTSRQKMVAGACGGLIYVIGGFADHGNGSVTYTNVTEIYDPSSDSWTTDATLPPIPAAFNDLRGNQFIAGAAVGDGIYVALLDPSTNPLFKYTPATHTWSKLPTGILTRDAASATVLDNRLYLLGALESMMGQATLTAFDLNRGVWFSNTSLSRQANAVTSSQALIAAHGSLYAVGGRDYLLDTSSPSVTGQVYRWTPAADTWTEDSPLPSPRHTVGLATVDDVIYAIGGSRDPWSTTVPVGDVSAGR